ncbi:Ankyrin repeat protein [Legionella moravica]|uniref:Ankyrin repeat protein n=1 Tax=Legionella moravica TaxID=39962 RepID=A0A378JWI9_9GAMM|nr:ankyrin repeat domain-containing protein [Legionella moravica]KTD34102.1 Ankyrin repeat protein [Legionella moravica]STX63023.1 Ankyrin repeat protein [Legionella moravica]
MMTKAEIQVELKRTGWTFIGQGSFSQVFCSQKELTINGQTCHWVIKKARGYSPLSAPQRIVKKWNDTNPEHPAFVSKHGLIAPYMGNVEATDEQIAVKLIDIYKRTGHIIADACSHKNFLYHNSTVYCVDFDNAFNRHSIESRKISFFTNNDFRDYFQNLESQGYPVSIAVIKGLGYLETLDSSENIIAEMIAKGFLTVRILQIIANYHLCESTLTELIQHLPVLARIEQIDPGNRIPNRLIVPSFITNIADGITDDTTLELLEEWLITHMILAPQLKNRAKLPPVLDLYGCPNEDRPLCLVNNEDVYAIRLLFKYERNGIHQRFCGLTLLHHAASLGKCASLRELINSDADLYARTEFLHLPEDEQESALEFAIKSEHGQAVKMLIEAGYQSEERTNELLDMSKRNPLNGFKLFIMTAQENILELLERLLQVNPDFINKTDAAGCTALIHASMRGHLSVVQYLVGQGACTNTKTMFLPFEKGSPFPNEFTLADWALYYSHQHVFEFFSSMRSIIIENDYIKPENLDDAFLRSDLAKIQWLIPQGSPLLKQIIYAGGTALHLAIMHKQDVIACYLVQAGSDLAIKSTKDTTPPRKNAWLTALYHNATKVIRSCLEHAIDQLIRLDPTEAIWQAARLGLLDSVKSLVAFEPRLINCTDQHNRTPLSFAIVNGHIDVVQFLIESGAQMDICLDISDDEYIPETPFNKCSPLELAQRLGNPEIIALLESAQARSRNTRIYSTSSSLFFAGSSLASSSKESITREAYGKR